MIKNLSHALCVPPTRDERTRQEFVASLRHHVLDDMAETMRTRYEQKVKPAFERRAGRAPAGGDEVHDVMLDDLYFQFYSSIRYNAQEMVFRSVIPVVDRNLDKLNRVAKELRESAENVGGELRLSPELKIPASVSSIDVHLSPGSYHSEYQDDDVSPGAIYDNSINVFAFNQMGANIDDIGHSFANYVKLAFPDFKPQQFLMLAARSGTTPCPGHSPCPMPK